MATAKDRLAESNDANLLVTAWIGIVDLATGQVDYVNAGHNPPPIHFRRRAGKFADVVGPHALVIEIGQPPTHVMNRLAPEHPVRIAHPPRRGKPSSPSGGNVENMLQFFFVNELWMLAIIVNDRFTGERA